ncbi:MAG: hypothetical protein LC650_03580, partial [Actinobacteria bacterium]|nr:hypothetical protein [Actinomycetota bacterium]
AIYNDTWANKTATSLTVTYAVIPRVAGGCIGDQENIVVTIDPEPDLVTPTPTLCSDEAIAVTLSDVHGLADSYEIVSISATGGISAGVGNATTGAGQDADAIYDDTWTNKTAIAQTVTYSVIPRIAGGCIGDEEDIVVTINPEPDLVTPAPAVCSDDAIEVTLSDVHTIANSYEIVSITATGGISGGGGNATTGTGQAADAIYNDTWTNRTATAQTVTYSVVPRIAGGCIGDEEDIVVTINPEPDLVTPAPTVCSDEAIEVTLSDVHGLADTYEIVSITPGAGLVAGAGNASTGAGQPANAIYNDTWNNRTATSRTVTYAVIPRVAGGCIGDQENIVVTINPEPDLVTPSPTVCSNDAIEVTLSDVHTLADSYEIVS